MLSKILDSSPQPKAARSVKHTTNVTIHEHRAPTDDSIKILREMEQKAEDNVLGSFSTPENCLRATLVALDRNALNKSVMLVVMFALNGKEYRVKEELPESSLAVMESRDEMLKLIFDLASRAIAQELFLSSMDDINSTLNCVSA